MSDSVTNIVAAIEAMRADLTSYIDKACDGLRTALVPEATSKPSVLKLPTLQDGHDPRNKNGLNLTERGVEILYRVFDDDGGYNRAAKMLSISQGAAKNRKGLWLKLGGKNRQKLVLDIDAA